MASCCDHLVGLPQRAGELYVVMWRPGLEAQSFFTGLPSCPPRTRGASGGGRPVLFVCPFVMGAGLLREWLWRFHAARLGFRARFVVPGPARWWHSRLNRLGSPPWPRGPVFEMHAIDSGRWTAPGRSPAEAARTFRIHCTPYMARWIAQLPDRGLLVGSTFNRLTPDERHWIADMGGWIAPVPIHPRMVTVYGPRASTTPCFSCCRHPRTRRTPSCWRRPNWRCVLRGRPPGGPSHGVRTSRRFAHSGWRTQPLQMQDASWPLSPSTVPRMLRGRRSGGH